MLLKVPRLNKELDRALHSIEAGGRMLEILSGDVSQYVIEEYNGKTYPIRRKTGDFLVDIALFPFIYQSGQEKIIYSNLPF